MGENGLLLLCHFAGKKSIRVLLLESTQYVYDEANRTTV